VRAGRLELAVCAGLAVLLVWGVTRAAALAWVCDDAFVSLRYAQNLVQGEGLVYNPGERVEGYTNLLWTLGLAGLIKLGVPDLLAAEWMGIAAFVALAAALAHAAWQRSRREGLPCLPLAAGVVLVSNDFHVWATGGLETLLFALLACEALLLLRRDPRSPRTALLAGVLLALLVLTRPDGILFAAMGVLSPWLGPGGRGARLRLSLAVLAPLALTLALLVPFKLAYYGELLPTAFYAKSAARPYLSQGLVYVGLYLAKNWFLPAAGALALLAFALRRRVLPEASRADDRFFLASAALFTAYIAWVGGDFMFARRILPAVPFVLLAIESRIVRIAAPGPRLALAFATLLAAALPAPLYARAQVINDVADERSFYPAWLIEARRRQGEAVGQALAGTPARVAIKGGLLVLAYYSKLPYVVETTGLTQYTLAKRPLAERGVIGHEKSANREWLREHGVQLLVGQKLPPVERPPGPPRSDTLYIGDIAKAEILVYDDAVMDPLRGRPGIEFVPIERVFAETRREMRAAPFERAQELYAGLHAFYLRHAGARGAAWDRELRGILEEKRTQTRADPRPAASRAAASTGAPIARARAAPAASTSSTSSGRIASASRRSRMGSKWASSLVSRSFFSSP
jgi:hypothetical protein